MQVSTILTFLQVVLAHEMGSNISIDSISKNVGLNSGTASRNAYYWAEGHKQMQGGHRMISINFDLEDRRKRDLRLTEKGKAFTRKLFLS